MYHTSIKVKKLSRRPPQTPWKNLTPDISGTCSQRKRPTLRQDLAAEELWSSDSVCKVSCWSSWDIIYNTTVSSRIPQDFNPVSADRNHKDFDLWTINLKREKQWTSNGVYRKAYVFPAPLTPMITMIFPGGSASNAAFPAEKRTDNFADRLRPGLERGKGEDSKVKATLPQDPESPRPRLRPNTAGERRILTKYLPRRTEEKPDLFLRKPSPPRLLLPRTSTGPSLSLSLRNSFLGKTRWWVVTPIGEINPHLFRPRLQIVLNSKMSKLVNSQFLQFLMFLVGCIF